jgi:ribbon-helix-helix CopG family protein
VYRRFEKAIGATTESVRPAAIIRLTFVDAKRLETRARKRGMSATELMRRMIKQHLDLMIGAEATYKNPTPAQGKWESFSDLPDGLLLWARPNGHV